MGIPCRGPVPAPGPGCAAAPSSRRAYDRVEVPTLIIEGAADKLLPPGWAAEIAAQVGGARSAVVDGAGHCPQIEQPRAVVDLVLDFLKEVA